MQAPDKLRCNARIAAAILDALAACGDAAGHGRARRVFATDHVNVRAEGSWIPRATLDRAFRVLGRDRDFARRVGYGLVSNQRIGFVLFTEGVATIEKAFRRCDALFAREEASGHFDAVEVSKGLARIAYRPGSADDDVRARGEDWNTAFCGVRQGMLEALPLGFGLLPARVTETECVANGAKHCCFEVRFDDRPRAATWTGLAVGLFASFAVLGFALATGVLPVGVALVLACPCALSGFAAGRAIDLARQLEAVAGARRGHLALLEQADRALAEKMDRLAKLDVRDDAAGEGNADRLRAILAERHDPEASDARPDPDDGRSARAAREIYEALGPLQRGLEQIHRLVVRSDAPSSDVTERVGGVLRECVDESRRLAAVGAALARDRRDAGAPREAVPLADVVARAIDSLRPTLLPGQRLQLAFDDALPMVRCEPFQMEQVAYQLLRNAADASDDDGCVRVELCAQPGSVELAIEDRGCGIPEEILDQVFDPFALEGSPSGSHGLGLAICYRIVREHGGELRVASEAGEGTRVSVVLPAEARVPESDRASGDPEEDSEVELRD